MHWRLVLALVLLRMEREEALIAPSVLLSKLFIEDMDGQMRQSGVGDLVVGKRMGKLMGALGGLAWRRCAMCWQWKRARRGRGGYGRIGQPQCNASGCHMATR